MNSLLKRVLDKKQCFYLAFTTIYRLKGLHGINIYITFALSQERLYILLNIMTFNWFQVQHKSRKKIVHTLENRLGVLRVIAGGRFLFVACVVLRLPVLPNRILPFRFFVFVKTVLISGYPNNIFIIKSCL